MSGALELRKLSSVADMLPHWRLIAQVIPALKEAVYIEPLAYFGLGQLAVHEQG